MYHLHFAAHCGMSHRVLENLTLEQARISAAARIRNFRKRRFTISVVDANTWEFTEPEDAVMVPDTAGIMHIRHETFECKECGQKWETKAERDYCCSEQERIDNEIENEEAKFE